MVKELKFSIGALFIMDTVIERNSEVKKIKIKKKVIEKRKKMKKITYQVTH